MSRGRSTARQVSGASPEAVDESGVRLTEKQAFEAMRRFLDGYWRRTQSDDIACVLSDLGAAPFGDAAPADPAAWADWVQCVQDSIKRA